MENEEFAESTVLYDAVAYEFQLLGSIVSNSEISLVEKYSRKYGIDFSGCSLLTEMLMTALYPRMLYQAAQKLLEKLNYHNVFGHQFQLTVY